MKDISSQGPVRISLSQLREAYAQGEIVNEAYKCNPYQVFCALLVEDLLTDQDLIDLISDANELLKERTLEHMLLCFEEAQTAKLTTQLEEN